MRKFLNHLNRGIKENCYPFNCLKNVYEYVVLVNKYLPNEFLYDDSCRKT